MTRAIRSLRNGPGRDRASVIAYIKKPLITKKRCTPNAPKEKSTPKLRPAWKPTTPSAAAPRRYWTLRSTGSRRPVASASASVSICSITPGAAVARRSPAFLRRDPRVDLLFEHLHRQRARHQDLRVELADLKFRPERLLG